MLKQKTQIMKCVKPLEGFTVNKLYILQGVGGEQLCLTDDNGIKVCVFEGYFNSVFEKVVKNEQDTKKKTTKNS